MSEIKSDEDEDLSFEDANNSFSANLNVDGESDVMDAAKRKEPSLLTREACPTMPRPGKKNLN